MSIGDTIYAGKRTGRVTSIREGWAWVRWWKADGTLSPETLYCRAD